MRREGREEGGRKEGDGLGFPEYQKWSAYVGVGLFLGFKILIQVPVKMGFMAPQQKKKKEVTPNVKMKMSEEEGLM